MNILLVLSLAMIAGLIFTRIMKFISLPNVTGYLIAGLLIGPFCFNLFSQGSLKEVEIITDVALGFIAFSIGSSFKLSDLEKLGKHIVIITFCQALCAVVFVDIVLWLIGVPLAEALTLGAIATATAPAATLLVVRQYKAKGIVTSTLLAVVAFDDAIGLMVFSISISIAKVLVAGTQLTINAMLLEPLLEIFLSLLIGGACGALLALCSRFFKSRANRISCIIAVVFGGLGLSIILNLSSLLVCMMIGALYANLYKPSAEPLDVMDRWTYPLYMLFFVISGAQLNLSVIPQVGLVGVVYIVVRSLGKYFGAAFGAKITHADKNVVKYLGLALLPQAGVAIGMAQMVMTQLPTYGTQISTIVLCATLVYELVGPVITKMALTKAGEIDKSMNVSIFSRFKKKTAVESQGISVNGVEPKENSVINQTTNNVSDQTQTTINASNVNNENKK